MLAELNVKDIALIREAGVEFEKGLNILTGETGAGKSVIIGSALLCLGEKAKTDMIREGADSAYAELVFQVTQPEKRKALSELGIDVPEDGTIVISRKLKDGRSVTRIGGETVSLSLLRQVASLLIDIYGQNEFHSLYDTANHLSILDSWLGEEIAKEKKEVREAWAEYRKCCKKREGFDLDEAARRREQSLIEYELNEIEEGHLKEGEEQELASLYKKLNNSRNIGEELSEAYQCLNDAKVDRAIACVTSALRYDESLSDILKELKDVQSVLQDASHSVHAYTEDLDLSEETLDETEKRLDQIRNLMSKYGQTVEDVQSYREEKAHRLEELESYEENLKKADRALEQSRETLKKKAEALSKKRREAAPEFCEKIRQQLLELGFESVKLELKFTDTQPQEGGMDTAEFLIALNPGQAVRSLGQVASGGELSRVMLAVKTVLAESDDIPTLIFDEIDAGISGRTAQKVAEKLDLIAKNHQVICITHLPQIASMADAHFEIKKAEQDGKNVTSIQRLSDKQSVQELARLLGGAKLTDAVQSNALEMKKFAQEIKKGHRS